ncbi:Bile salt-activated lipase [Portunus trituberculatus]|uniref:Bile salt-activated lipase n=1 Tax=Portunus trituberculatus TaxID=210409 RepID=A0A5B7CGW5_PORTR|nr:Bile salt-activated lipase [Portunus trituberculatus]
MSQALSGRTSVIRVGVVPGLFTGAIMESGTTLSPWAKGRDFLATAQAVAERFDCPTLPTDDLVACLQTVGAHLLDMSYFTLYVRPNTDL